MIILEAQALYSLRPGAAFSYTEDGRVWLDTEQAEPTQTEIDLELVRLQSVADYKYPRMEAYPSIGDQLDALFHAGVFPEDMAAQIQAVKDAHPKP